MTFAARVAESPRSIRWHRARITSALIYRPAFGGFGPGTVLVRPQRLQGIERIYLGERCAFFEDAWLACEPGAGSITVGDDNYFGQSVHLHAIDPISIGSHCVVADGVFIATTDHGRTDRATTHGTGRVTIGDHVFIGQRSVILGGVTIGDGATVGAHAVVTRDVPSGATVAGVPAKVVG